jgi:hypothetical protein
MSDASIRTGSGRTWDEWFRVLDDWGAADRSHRDIARWLRDERGVPGWRAQTVTVGTCWAVRSDASASVELAAECADQLAFAHP